MNFEFLYLIFVALITASLGLSCLDWPSNFVCSLWDFRFLWVAVSYVAGGYGHARFLFFSVACNFDDSSELDIRKMYILLLLFQLSLLDAGGPRV